LLVSPDGQFPSVASDRFCDICLGATVTWGGLVDAALLPFDAVLD